jgi:hypothetical protein
MDALPSPRFAQFAGMTRRNGNVRLLSPVAAMR